MNIVTFPAIGISIKVSRIAFNFFGIDIYSYAICVVLGIITAFVLCFRSEDNYYIKRNCLEEIILFSIIFGIIGARIYYVIFNLKYYFFNPAQIFNLRDGGLAIYGSLIAGGITCVKVCRKYRVNPIDFFDYIVPFVALAQCIGRWGNFFNIEAYGYETTNFFRMRIPMQDTFIDVHPVFLYESVIDLLIFIFLRKMQPKRKFQGQILYSYLFLYTGARFFLEGLRVDSLMFFNLRISKVLSLFVCIYSLIILVKKIINYRYKKSKEIKRKEMK